MATIELEKLIAQDYSKQLIFAYLACERMYPNYEHFSTKFKFGQPLILQRAISYVYEAITGKNIINSQEIDELLAKIHLNTPHTNDFATFYATIAMNSGGVIYESINLLKQQDTRRILIDISTMVTDAIDCFIQVRDDMDYDDPEFEEKIEQDPIMKTEVAIQNGIIKYLNSIAKAEPSDVETLLRLQEYSKPLI